MPISEPIDEDELEADLAAMEQEKLDDQMLSTGTTVPVADRIDRERMPSVANGESEFLFPYLLLCLFMFFLGEMALLTPPPQCSQIDKNPHAGASGGRRRGGRVEAFAGGDGYDGIMPTYLVFSTTERRMSEYYGGGAHAYIYGVCITYRNKREEMVGLDPGGERGGGGCLLRFSGKLVEGRWWWW